MNQDIHIPALARVEGEGELTIRLKDGEVNEIILNIYEPPRFFEGFLHGRYFQDVPDITARICGICPVAYQMSSVQALESALQVTITPEVRQLRQLLYCAEYIESHALHIYLLQAPDLVGYESAISLAADAPDLVKQALRLKKAGNELLKTIGGRSVHPVNTCVGGFYRWPSIEAIRALVPELEWARQASIDTVKWAATLSYPDFEQDYEFVALSHPDEYPFNEGRLASNKGVDIDVSEFGDHFVEQHVKHSNALHCRLRERGAYLVGPLARFNLNFDKLPEIARQAASDCGAAPPYLNPFRSIVVRAVELVFACEEALRLIAQYEPPSEPRVEAPVRAGTGHAATEAPRGVLYHRYEIDEHGLIVNARIVPPTSQNQKRIEDDLWHFVPQLTALPLEKITAKCEQAVRNYDPCISCATHFVKVERVP